MSNDSDEEDGEEPPELYAALAVAVLGLDLIMRGVPTKPHAAAWTTLDILRRKHPVAASLLPKDLDDLKEQEMP